MHRFYISAREISGDVAWLPRDEAQHALNVLRMREGDELEVFDGEGKVYNARITLVDKKSVSVALGEGVWDDAEPQTRVTLYQGVPKAGKMELIIQKCTELGVYGIVPVLTQHCVVRLSQTDAQARQARWQRVALEAAKQCGRSVIPVIDVPVALEAVKERFLSHGLALLPWEQARETSLKQALGGCKVCDIGMLVGPEGGLAEEEVLPLVQGGARCVTLGKRILRTETVGMALMAIINYEMDEMQ